MQRVLSTTVLALSLAACGGKSSGTPAKEQAPENQPSALKPADTPAPAQPAQATPPAQYGLVLSLAQFSGATPKPARFELLTSAAGAFKVEGVEDADSNVFHKVLPLPLNSGWGLVSLGGTKAVVKLYQRTSSGWAGKTLWTESFGGKFDRMRDAELGDVDADGAPDIVVGTHDQGVVAYLSRGSDATWAVNKLDHQPNTFIHEIELGDLDGDGVI
jgi:hypothetical protein